MTTRINHCITMHTNRDGWKLYFVQVDDITVFMTGYINLGVTGSISTTITAVDPNGGPLISLGSEIGEYVMMPSFKKKGITVQRKIIVIHIKITTFGVIFTTI